MAFFLGVKVNPEWWNKARAFHGHECPGLAIGVKACEAGVIKMGINPAFDEELVCVTENNACGVDAVQALLGCTLGKGNLIFNETGKMAFTFLRRDNGRAMRFYFKAVNPGMERLQYQEYLLNTPACDLFDCTEVAAVLPERARFFKSVACEVCGEYAVEHKIRLKEGKRVCLDCFNSVIEQI